MDEERGDLLRLLCSVSADVDAKADEAHIRASWKHVHEFVQENIKSEEDAAIAGDLLLRVEATTGDDDDAICPPVAIICKLLSDQDNRKATGKARGDMWDTVELLLDCTHLSSHVVDRRAAPLFAKCIDVFGRDDVSCRANALHVAIKLLEARPVSLTVEAARASEVCAQLVLKLAVDKNLKTSLTARAAAFTMLGTLLTTYPDTLADATSGNFNRRWLLDASSKVLREKAGAKLSATLQGGALHALAAALMLSQPHEALAERELAYQSALVALDSLAGPVTRYDGALGALRLLTLPGAGLAPKIYADVLRLVALLIRVGSSHSNKKVRVGIDAALVAVLEQVRTDGGDLPDTDRRGLPPMGFF